jgi:hypothetical protein
MTDPPVSRNSVPGANAATHWSRNTEQNLNVNLYHIQYQYSTCQDPNPKFNRGLIIYLDAVFAASFRLIFERLDVFFRCSNQNVARCISEETSVVERSP